MFRVLTHWFTGPLVHRFTSHWFHWSILPHTDSFLSPFFQAVAAALANNDASESESESDEEDDWVSTYTKSKWIFNTVLVPDSQVHQRTDWKWTIMNLGLRRLNLIQTKYAFDRYYAQMLNQRRSDSREGAATVVQQYVRAYQGRMLARHLYTRAVRRDRRNMRSKRRVARMVSV